MVVEDFCCCGNWKCYLIIIINEWIYCFVSLWGYYIFIYLGIDGILFGWDGIFGMGWDGCDGGVGFFFEEGWGGVVCLLFLWGVNKIYVYFF